MGTLITARKRAASLALLFCGKLKRSIWDQSFERPRNCGSEMGLEKLVSVWNRADP